jgi:hypothetical protein
MRGPGRCGGFGRVRYRGVNDLMPYVPQSDFDINALYDALNAQRRARGLSWEAVARQISGRFADVRSARAVSASTLSGLQRRSIVEGDGVLQMLLWLRRTPESFVAALGAAAEERNAG